MRKFTALSATSLLVAALVSFVMLPSQYAREKEPKKFSKRANANLETRKAQIQQELGTPTVSSWAGQYYYGDGLGVNVELSLAPKSGFAFTWNGCLGLYDMNYGDVDEVDGKIRLVFKLPNEQKPFQGIASEFLPVVWGNRHYLIPSDEVLKFANAINAGFEPREGAWGEFLLRRDDVSKPANGYPNLPSEYAEYLLKHPIDAEISSIKESHTKESGRVTKVIFNVGTSQGIKKGMEFYLYAPSGLFESATVTAVNSTSAEAEIFQCCNDNAGLPSVGWKLSTHVGNGCQGQDEDKCR